MKGSSSVTQTPGNRSPLRHLRAKDVRGAVQLATQATTGVTHIVEGVHQSVLGTLGAASGKTLGQTGGLTGLIYQTVRGVTHLLGKGMDAALSRLQALLESVEGAPPETPQREAVLAALNGVMGDRLAATGSPFATRMALRYQDQTLTLPTLPAELAGSRKLVLLIHGLCMNDLQWHHQHEGQALGHGTLLAKALGATPLYLRYNSGLHVSDNGQALSVLLEQLLAQSGIAVDDVTVVAHSMGGLLIRSAMHQARKIGLRWPATVKNIVFLGTPHHGAPLERAGNWVDVLLGSTRWSAPLARLGQLRSAGITDLRYGFVAQQDWHGHERFRRRPDRRLPVPLPEGVACYAVAATTAARRSLLADRLVGDGLVPLHSALGQHADPLRTLAFTGASQWIAYKTNHMALLRSPEVAAQVLHWLAPAQH